MKPGLLLVDIQNDYFTAGKLELCGMEVAAHNAQRLLGAFRKAGLPLIHIQHQSLRQGAPFFVPGTNGVEIHPSVQPLPGETVQVKHVPNSFKGTGLAERLREQGVEDVIICGAMSHMCIDATTRAAFDLDFRCLVAEDACATCSLEYQGKSIDAEQVHGAFMAALAYIYADVISTDGCLARFGLSGESL